MKMFKFKNDLMEIISSFPPIQWEAYFEVAAYRSVAAFENGLPLKRESVYLISGFTDRLNALNRLVVYMRRINETGLIVKWLVNIACGIPCPDALISLCAPHVVIVNDYTYPGSKAFGAQWPRTGALAKITELFFSGMVHFGQPIERSPLSLDEDVLPFVAAVKKTLNIHSDPLSFSVHIRGGDFAAAQNDKAMTNSAILLKPLIKGRNVTVFSDDQALAETYCQELEGCGIRHLKNIRPSESIQHDHTIEDFCSIASSGAMFVARKNMGKFAIHAAGVGNVEEVYDLDSNNAIKRTDCLGNMKWYASVKCPKTISYYKIVVKWRIKFLIRLIQDATVFHIKSFLSKKIGI